MAGKVLLLGVGFDNKDGHVRITVGDNFGISGGSGETHEQIKSAICKLNKELREKGLTLEDICLSGSKKIPGRKKTKKRFLK